MHRREDRPRCAIAGSFALQHRNTPLAIIVERPDALIFTAHRTFTVRAWVCAACGYMELYVDDPHGLAESYQRFLDKG